ncbi:PREDICTED: uncharacterized protein LOC104586494 [Nelumbo nucifera]|uniref:Uncharacterized protein LOC104586494 n=1 Tax=Nelumbo nucifera TaxID=4432 RepID=A0A1U7Z421_NELNU|nr:PREDICTED: uncharacterized protein LOC104586494 [Nelumbo nucifera]
MGKEEYMKWPGKMKRNPKRGNPKKYCKYHRNTCPNIEDCYELKNEIKSLIRRGHLKEYVGGDTGASSSQQQQQQDEAQAHHTLAGVIDVLAGGMPSGGASTLALKAYARQFNIQGPTPKKSKPDDVISFSNDDLQGVLVPYNDTLMVSMTITNYMVKRILVDSSASADILFNNTFEKMKLTLDRLQPIDVPLVGFSRVIVKAEGKIILPVMVRAEPWQVTRMIELLVVKIGSSYNAIIGRLTLHTLKATISSYHLTMKFPTEHGIGVIRGN